MYVACISSNIGYDELDILRMNGLLIITIQLVATSFRFPILLMTAVRSTHFFIKCIYNAAIHFVLVVVLVIKSPGLPMSLFSDQPHI